MRKSKQTRPLYIPKPEERDFPFNIQDIEPNELKRIDFFRMYTCLRMMVEKIVPDQGVQGRLSQNIDKIFKVFIEKDHNPPQPQRMVGRRNSPHTYQKEEFWNYIEDLNSMGYSYKQISDKLQVHYVQISTHHRNTVNYADSEEEEGEKSSSSKKQQKEKQKVEQVVQQQSHDVFYSDDGE